MIRKAIYLIGLKLRNDLIWKNYEFLCNSQHWSIEQLKSRQVEKCKALLTWAYDHSDYYREKYVKAGVKPKDFNDLSDLKHFPIMEKSELIENAKNIQAKGDFKKLFFSETSGSTGQPLIFYRNKEWDAWHRAAIFRGYSWYNVLPWGKEWGISGATILMRKNRGKFNF